jgi:XTP/dITP diphosphohydrolase
MTAPDPIRRGDTLLIATTNPDKLREITALLEGVPLVLLPLSAPGELALIPAPVEDGATFEDNARLKARYYAQASGLLTVAEDSGLEVDALDGRPGVHSARYPGRTYAERFDRLYAEIAASRRAERSARFVCALALAWPDRLVFQARGAVEGVIAPEPRGAEGFGYDPIFFYPPYGRTLAEVTSKDKRRVAHRGVAFRQLRAFLERALTGAS